MVRWERASKHGVWGITESPSLSLSLFSLPPPPPSTLFYQQHEARGGRKGASERARVLCVRCCIPPRPSTAVTLDILTILDRQARNGIVTSICLF